MYRYFQHGNLVLPITKTEFACQYAGWHDITDRDDILDTMPHDEIEALLGLHVEVDFDIEAYKSEKYLALKIWHDTQTNNMKAKYSASEVESFLDKRNEALAWSLNQEAPTPYIDAMSGGDEATRLILLNSVLNKVKAAAQLEAYVLYIRDQIEASSTKERIDSIMKEINV